MIEAMCEVPIIAMASNLLVTLTLKCCRYRQSVVETDLGKYGKVEE